MSDYCESCGSRVQSHKHNMTKLLAEILIAVAGQVRDQGDYNYRYSDLKRRPGVSKTMMNNHQKLRYFALIAKQKDENGKPMHNHWLLTKWGSQFLKGEYVVPKQVTTYRNRITKKSPQHVSLRDVLKRAPYLQDFYEFSALKEAPDAADIEMVKDRIVTDEGKKVTGGKSVNMPCEIMGCSNTTSVPLEFGSPQKGPFYCSLEHKLRGGRK